ncbi:MAG: hypothetical protein ACRD0B_12045 [Acidimicrobiales bacterium]
MNDAPRAPVVRGTLAQVGVGSGRLLWRFPGVGFTVVAYVATADGLLGTSYERLWGVLAAVVAGAGWYLSPLGRLEAARRRKGPPEPGRPGARVS